MNRLLSLMVALLVGPVGAIAVADEGAFAPLKEEFRTETHSLLKRYCVECHSSADKQGELDLEQFASLAEVRRQPGVWQKVAEMLDNGEMPPKDARQPSEAERRNLRGWVARYLAAEARSNAGDPGPVILRRLSNAEYTYTVRDLTGVPLDPAREFPADGAAGEGFTNAGAALAMSPALLQKYLDAGKEIASHAVLLPDGIRFSPSTTRRDWTEEALAAIHRIYDRDTESAGATPVNLQGIVFKTNAGGRLPIEAYIAAALEERESLRSGSKSIAEVARERRLNSKYLGLLWDVLEKPGEPSLLLDQLRATWKTAKPGDADSFIQGIAQWQRALFRFATVGHIGKAGGPRGWMEPVSPLVASHDVRRKLVVPPGANEVTLYLSTSDASDGNDGDVVVWSRPRLVSPGRPDIPLKDIQSIWTRLEASRQQLIATAAECLAAADEATSSERVDVAALASKHGVEPGLLSAWINDLGLNSAPGVGTLLTNKLTSVGGYDFVRGWSGANALSVLANSSDQHVRVPGNMAPHGVAMHPAPTIQVGAAWTSPGAGAATISARVQHAHPECGNGVRWSVEVRRGRSLQRLAEGNSKGGAPIDVGPFRDVPLRTGDVVLIIIAPKDGNHSCDLTAVDLSITTPQGEWNLSRDVSPDILAGNPHADRQGKADMWRFFGEPAAGSGRVIPPGSLLARWMAAPDSSSRRQLAQELEKLLAGGVESLPADSPDRALYRRIASLEGPLAHLLLDQLKSDQPAVPGSQTQASSIGLDPLLFGRLPGGGTLPADSFAVQAPSVVAVRIPAELAQGAELVVSCALHESAAGGSAQVAILDSPPASPGLVAGNANEGNKVGPWTSGSGQVAHSMPILVREGSDARKRFETAFDDFRKLFPPALCYSKIVPVDEVVTLTQFYREDEPLKRLMLTSEEAELLDALWDELHFVSQDALTQVDALQQLIEFATQDGDPKVFEPLKKPIHERAEAFRRQLLESEPAHVESVIELASRAWRRPLNSEETSDFKTLYGRLRAEEVAHEQSVRLLIARVFSSPNFLYRPETAPSGTASGPVTPHELATRLSYFLWSSAPDSELRRLADSGELDKPEVLAAQVERMLRDDRVRRLATEFGCQWLHVYDFDRLDEKSDRHFPEFKELRGDMYEEVIRHFARIFHENRSVKEIYSSEDAFVSGRLAKFYGFENVQLADDEWGPVARASQWGRGGILTQAATLAKQSGASRTSPILRGNWISEVLLGERLPRPPKDVPQLPDEAPAGDLTVRQLIEKHTSDERCARCHVRIDPFGFALEEFNAIGRRLQPAAGAPPIDTASRLANGAQIDGVRGLTRYLLVDREHDLVRQFIRKLTGYALGRSVQLSDEPLVAEIHSELKANDFRVAAAVRTIVLSRQFREIRGRDAAPPEASQ